MELLAYCIAEVDFLSFFIHSNILTIVFFILDDVDKLNAEDKAFVEDPANADLFSDPAPAPATEVTGKKRSRENQDCDSGLAKKVKPTSTNEVKAKTS